MWVPPDEARRAQLRKQTEFYFSDRNYPNDRHLQALAARSPEEWVPLAELVRFPRIERLLPSADVVQVSASEFSTGFVGQTATKTRDVFDSARGAVLCALVGCAEGRNRLRTAFCSDAAISFACLTSPEAAGADS